MTTFLALRHGETDWNVKRLCQGQHDMPLNSVGEEQAVNAGKLLKDYSFAAVYCSPLIRARRTAELALEGLYPIDQVIYDEHLLERSFGEYEGQPFDRELIPPVYLKAMDADPVNFSYPGGESLHDVENRLKPFVAELRGKYPDQTVLLVSHRMVLSVLTCVVRGVKVESGTQFMYDNAKPTFVG